MNRQHAIWRKTIASERVTRDAQDSETSDNDSSSPFY